MSIDEETLQHAVNEHGHLCPGLVVGIHAAELAVRELGAGPDTEVRVAAERDNCVVDALRILAGCTYDPALAPGESEYLLARTADGRRVRLTVRPGVFDSDPEWQRLWTDVREGEATPAERERFRTLQRTRADELRGRAADDVLEAAVVPTP